jgi:hypothetical protein
MLVVDRPLPQNPPDRRLYHRRPRPGGGVELARARARRLPPPLPRAATFGWLTKRPFPSALIVSAASRKGKPTTSNAGSARCAHASAAWCAEPTPFPKTLSATSTPSICSSPPTTSESNNSQRPVNHYRQPEALAGGVDRILCAQYVNTFSSPGGLPPRSCLIRSSNGRSWG